MKRLADTINLLGTIITVASFFGIYFLSDLLKKLEAGSVRQSLVYIAIVILIILIAITILFLVFYHNRLKGNNAFLIEKYLDKYVKGEGVNFLSGLSPKDKELVSKTKKSIKMLTKKGTTNTLDSEVYYMYLFSLLDGATKRIWAASIVGAEEWIDTPEEDEFLRLNIKASSKKVLVERVFIVKRDAIEELLDNKAIKTQIDKRNDYLKTYLIVEEELIAAKPNLLTDIGSGFLAFDDFAIATDVFQDSFIRGILTLEEETISRNNRIFTNLRDFAKPLDKNSVNYFKTH